MYDIYYMILYSIAIINAKIYNAKCSVLLRSEPYSQWNINYIG